MFQFRTHLHSFHIARLGIRDQLAGRGDPREAVASRVFVKHTLQEDVLAFLCRYPVLHSNPGLVGWKKQMNTSITRLITGHV